MGKYSRISKLTPPPQRPWVIHPIWRGFGCLLFVFGPLLALGVAHLLVEEDLKRQWFQVPAEMLGAFRTPNTIYFFDKTFTFPLRIQITHFFADLVLAALLILLGFALVMIMYSIVYSILGPKRYGPQDAPPIRRRPTKRRK